MWLEIEKVLWNSINKKQNRNKQSKNEKSSTLHRFKVSCKDIISVFSFNSIT